MAGIFSPLPLTSLAWGWLPFPCLYNPATYNPPMTFSCLKLSLLVGGSPNPYMPQGLHSGLSHMSLPLAMCSLLSKITSLLHHLSHSALDPLSWTVFLPHQPLLAPTPILLHGSFRFQRPNDIYFFVVGGGFILFCLRQVSHVFLAVLELSM